jgi:peptidoglycan-associated lipoprotein
MAAAMMMFLVGCETTKHAETMSAEELAAFSAEELAAFEVARAQGSGASEDTEQNGISLGSAVGSVSSSESAVPLISGLSPEGPPSPILRGGFEESSVSDSGTIDASGMSPPNSSLRRGDDVFEGEQFARNLTPLGESNAGGSAGSTTDEEVVRLPNLTDAQESMKPLREGDVREGDVREGAMGGVGVELDHVYFGFDQFLIRQSEVATLQVNAQLLNAKYQNSAVLVEGHCDERGTSDYNVALGERRAQAVKDYLIDLGVLGSRIQIVSYGKERPSCTEPRESCWQQNRRGHFELQ